MTCAEQPLRVLVVDDEEALGLGVRRVLDPFRVPAGEAHQEAALEVRIARSGEEALEALKDFPADLLLLDYKLPGIDGIEVLRRLTGNGGGPMTIMITAYASLETAVKATKMGSYDFLAKPFTPEELRYVVRKAAEHILLRRHAQRLAAEKRRIRFEFLSILAHELKAPLDAVEGYLDILVEKAPGENARMLGRCQERITGMKKLILDLLDLTRIESGEKNRDLKSLDLVGVLRRGVETQLPRAGKKGVRIEVDAPAALEFRADEGEMDIIFNNLLSNAVKYNAPSGRVAVTLRRSPEGVELRSRTPASGSPRTTRPSCSRSSCASAMPRRPASRAAAWGFRRCASWRCSTAETCPSRAPRARAAPSPSACGRRPPRRS